MVRFRIKRVVNRMTVGRAQTLVVVDYRRSAAIGENKIVLANESAKRVGSVGFYPRQGCGRIYVPERDPGIFGAALQNFFFQQLIKYSHAAVLDYQITFGSMLQQCGDFFSIFVIGALSGLLLNQIVLMMKEKKE